MKRILLVLATALIMAAMMVATALPAFADNKEPKFNFNCHHQHVESPSGNQNFANGCTSHINPAG